MATIAVFNVQAQSHINIKRQKINRLDKQNRKQGEWIFFDKKGFVQMSCFFQNNICISPQIFYENSDTAFVKLPMKDSTEPFILFQDNENYVGSFIHTSDSTTLIEVESDTMLNSILLLKIKKYQDIIIQPIYFFAQKKLSDYLSASFSSSNIIFNKSINVVLYISSSGNVTKVELPRGKNNLSVNEENELSWIYSTMPRWQPLFYKNSTQSAVVQLSSNSTLSLLSFNH